LSIIEAMTAGFFRKCWPSPVLGATKLVAALTGAAGAGRVCEYGALPGFSYGFLDDDAIAAAAGAMPRWDGRLLLGIRVRTGKASGCGVVDDES
jgi:hypothetical protein